jgi:hypothetical protein
VSTEINDDKAYSVVLSGSGETYINLIREVRILTGLGLREAKDMVDKARAGGRVVVADQLTYGEAHGVWAALESAGGVVFVEGPEDAQWSPHLREAIGAYNGIQRGQGDAANTARLQLATTAALISIAKSLEAMSR